MNPEQHPSVMAYRERIRRMREILPTKLPELTKYFRAFKRIIPPAGYVSPNDFYDGLACVEALDRSIIKDFPSEASADETCAVAKVVSWQSQKYKVPIYFVGAELLKAILRTDFPAEMKLGDLKWPMPSMTFFLPIKESLEAFEGAFVPWINFARVEAGELRSPINRAAVRIWNPAEKIIAHASVWSEKSAGLDYSESIPVTKTMAEALKETEVTDFTGIYERRAPEKSESEFDTMMVKLPITIAVKLILALNARPDLITPERILRKERVRRGKIEKDALWSPNIIGGIYRSRSERGATQTGATLRYHWRRGHFRNQRHGKGFELTKVIWLEPMEINKPE